jgi:riboflavin synthase
MFTGIIQALGKISRIDKSADSARIEISAGGLDLGDVKLGDSIAVSGPCLTVIEFDADSFAVDVSTETLERTTLGSKRVGTAVNLEKALRLSDRLGGHLVSGHVDGVGRVVERAAVDGYVRFRIDAPQALAKYFAEKGSVSVDGVSLTVNAVSGTTFELMIIPHTLQETTLGSLAGGDPVNLEIDLVARYLERLSSYDTNPAGTGLTAETLRRSGFTEN